MTIKKGDKGSHVTKIQKALDAADFWTYGKFTENFGSVTEAAVKEFQKAKGLTVDGEVGPNTMKALGVTIEESTTPAPKAVEYSKEQIEEAVKAKGYAWFEDEKNKGYDVNIVGVRNLAQGTKVTNVFDDFLTISFKEDGEWKFFCWMATTDPGKKGVEKYHNKNGVAVLKPGQYRGSHKIRLHQGKYEALGQQKNVTVYRDADRDLEFDLQEDKTQTGLFGINIHRSNPKTESTYVENWSEGCQVFKKVKDFKEFMKICNKAAKIHGNSFTYTLLESTDIK